MSEDSYRRRHAGINDAAGGCSERLLRETVFASTESLVGVSVAQNPRSQGYELRAGFARSELFLVPTDKAVMYDGETQGETGVRPGAERTANVLAEISVGGSSRGPGTDGEITQRIAVGDLAVRSGAAVAMLARDPALAHAVNPALTAKPLTPARAALLAQIEWLRASTPSPVTVTIDGNTETFADGRALGDRLVRGLVSASGAPGATDLRTFRITASEAQLERLVARWQAAISAGAGGE